MAKGTISKNVIFSKLQEVYPDSFWEDEGKILRVPLNEDGARVEIKVTLTAAKANLGGDSVPSAFSSEPKNAAAPVQVNHEPVPAPTEEEKQNVANLIKALGL